MIGYIVEIAENQNIPFDHPSEKTYDFDSWIILWKTYLKRKEMPGKGSQKVKLNIEIKKIIKFYLPEFSAPSKV